jgi:catechol 2,3-dioxygenase
LGAGGYHHYIGLNIGTALAVRHHRLGTVVFLSAFPTAQPWHKSRRVVAAGMIDGAADHGVSEALYLRDPGRRELYIDRDPAVWPRGTNGDLRMVSRPFDVAAACSRRIHQSLGCNSCPVWSTLRQRLRATGLQLHGYGLHGWRHSVTIAQLGEQQCKFLVILDDSREYYKRGAVCAAMRAARIRRWCCRAVGHSVAR